MDTRQLKTLLAIAETGSFAKAAQKVSLTPSAVSQQIQALESEVGASLFDRLSRPPTLTSAGHQMVEAAAGLVRTAENVIDAIAGQAVVGTFSIGSVRTSMIGLLPRAIRKLVANHPGLKIKLRVGNSEAMMHDVVAGRLDTAVVVENSMIGREVQWHPFIREPLDLIAPPGTPVRPLEEMLTRHPYVRFQADVPLVRLIEAELGKLDLPIVDIAEMDTVSAITACVASGLGVSIVPRLAAEGSGADLVTVPFGAPVVSRRIGLLKGRKAPRAVLIAELHSHLAEVSGDYGVFSPDIASSPRSPA